MKSIYKLVLIFSFGTLQMQVEAQPVPTSPYEEFLKEINCPHPPPPPNPDKDTNEHTISG